MAHSSDTIDIISSSPEFPDLFAPVAKPPPKKPVLPTDSNAAAIPSNSVGFGTFTSAASIWRLSQVVEEEKPAPKSPPQPDTRTITTSVSITTTAVSEEKPAKKPRKPRKKKDETTATDENAPPKPPARRGRPPKQKDADGQTALPKSKVTKPAAKPRKKSETVSKNFAASAQEEPSKAPKLAPVRIDHEPIDLEPADRRRLDWTPPPHDRPPPEPSSTTAHTDPPVAFGKLLDTYACKPENGQLSQATKVDVLGKRKLIEMVATTTTTTTITTTDKPTSPEASPTKTKAPKKKPRTITDLATAAYRIQDPADDSPSTVTSKQDTLLGYIDVEDDDKAATKPSGGKTKAASKKPAKPRVSKKKPEPRRQLLLSPQSALRQVSGQDFVFGTSSQLVTEDTDLLRALHESLKAAGNTPDSHPFTSSPVRFSNLASRRKTGNNKLWRVGARDEHGHLLDLDVFDLTEAVEVPEDLLQQAGRPSDGVSEEAELGEHGQGKTQTAIEILSSDPVVPGPSTIRRHETKISTLSTKEKSIHNITKPPPPNPVAPPRARTPQKSRSPSRESTPPHPKVLPPAKTPPPPTTPPRASAVLDFDFDFDDYEPPPSNQEHYQLLEQSQKTSPSKTQQQQQQRQQKKMDPPPRPKYELFTDAQLSREMASYGFKPIKKRAAMISLLQQCWDSISTGTSTGVDPLALSPNRAGRGRTAKSATAVQEEAEEAGRKLAAPAATKRPRGRPKKIMAATTIITTTTTTTTTTAPPSRMSTTDRPEKASAAGGAVHGTAAASKPAYAPLPVLSASTPKRQCPTMLEIPDSDIDDASDSDPFASSPSSASPSASQLFSTPENHQDHDHNDAAAAEMFLPTDMECDESLLDVTPSTSTEADLFKHITEAITTASRSGNPSDPSWHEKILMYDPIILEDLTAWLNTAGQGLDRVGWEDEAGTEEVRRWCETKGVGWVWREGNRGQVRKRF
ncbi:hypothetical protein QBC32DRAFT_68291 [Pseudoneurospora amorphoporcata]|uniref:Structure-specific endonuclease subunit SLX4 n=1 Tax=Pseudoneurospora amorphoporcata TaxID=241081 RepID=A0AAN6SIH5_9PEZI|nr:hypothetical protein QBC32DRAFT_68291 [Pseudoneurospora amorphoporcata]